MEAIGVVEVLERRMTLEAQTTLRDRVVRVALDFHRPALARPHPHATAG